MSPFCIKNSIVLKCRAYKKEDIFAKMYRSQMILVKKLDKLTKCSKNNILVSAYYQGKVLRTPFCKTSPMAASVK